MKTRVVKNAAKSLPSLSFVITWVYTGFYSTYFNQNFIQYSDHISYFAIFILFNWFYHDHNDTDMRHQSVHLLIYLFSNFWLFISIDLTFFLLICSSVVVFHWYRHTDTRLRFIPIPIPVIHTDTDTAQTFLPVLILVSVSVWDRYRYRYQVYFHVICLVLVPYRDWTSSRCRVFGVS